MPIATRTYLALPGCQTSAQRAPHPLSLPAPSATSLWQKREIRGRTYVRYAASSYGPTPTKPITELCNRRSKPELLASRGHERLPRSTIPTASV